MKTMEILPMQRGGNGKNPRNRNLTGNRTLSYCWTHEDTDNLAHTRETCKNKREVHVNAATWKNKMGGSDQDYSK